MIRNAGSGKLPLLMLLPGAAALALRRGLYAAAVDAKGLLIQNHPLEIALLVLTAAALLTAVLAAWKAAGELQNTGDLRGVLGNVAAGLGILATTRTGLPVMGGYLTDLWWILAQAAPVCFGLAAVFRAFGKRPFFLLHVVPCLFLLVHLVTRYQVWSGHPQMQDYVFAMLGAMALLFFTFYTAAMEADCGSPRIRLGMGLAAVYLCMAELARSSCPGLYLGGMLWVLADLCSLQKVSDHKK